MEVRSAIQQIALEHRRPYGCRRIAAELRRRGMQVNHRRVLRMMRKENLLAVRRRRFVICSGPTRRKGSPKQGGVTGLYGSTQVSLAGSITEGGGYGD